MEQIKENTWKLNKNQYLEKKKKGYRIITPWKKDLNQPLKQGNINWRNVFRCDWIMIAIVILLLISAMAYKHDTQACRELMKDPMKICGRVDPSGNIIYPFQGFRDINVTKISENEFSIPVPS